MSRGEQVGVGKEMEERTCLLCRDPHNGTDIVGIAAVIAEESSGKVKARGGSQTSSDLRIPGRRHRDRGEDAHSQPPSTHKSRGGEGGEGSGEDGKEDQLFFVRDKIDGRSDGEP